MNRYLNALILALILMVHSTMQKALLKQTKKAVGESCFNNSECSSGYCIKDSNITSKCRDMLLSFALRCYRNSDCNSNNCKLNSDQSARYCE